MTRGDPDAALAAADVKVEATYSHLPSSTTRWSPTAPSPTGARPG